MPNEEQKKKLLNIWEQVEKNKEDILSFLYGNKTLAEFGIKVIGVLTSAEELPNADTYEGDFGDAFAVGEESPYDYYVFTREGADGVVGFWLNIGEFPKAGPQGEPGEQGEQGPQGERGPTGSTGPRGATGLTGPIGPAGTAPTIGENGNWYRDGVDTGLPARGPQGEQGEPGSFFHIRGKVASSDLLPAAADVDDQAAYLVGADAPYDVYCIMDVSGTHYWVNLGPVAVQESDTKVGSLTFAASGTLSAEVLNALVNTTTADFLKIGDKYFVKQSTGHYYALKRDTGEMLVYALDIDLVTGEWVITTETMVDLDSAQTITGVKTFNADILGTFWKIENNSYYFGVRRRDGNAYMWYADASNFNVRNLLPIATETQTIGSSSQKWKDGYFAGQVYAQNTFNVINASDIVSNTLTQEQYDLITNGKPTLIKGVFLNVDSLFIFPAYYTFGTNILFMCFGTISTRYNISYFQINTSTKVCTINDSTKHIRLNNLEYINGKTIPNYPTANTSPQVLTIAANGGALSWENGLFKHKITIGTTDGNLVAYYYSHISTSHNNLTLDKLLELSNRYSLIFSMSESMADNLGINRFVMIHDVEDTEDPDLSVRYIIDCYSVYNSSGRDPNHGIYVAADIEAGNIIRSIDDTIITEDIDY